MAEREVPPVGRQASSRMSRTNEHQTLLHEQSSIIAQEAGKRSSSSRMASDFRRPIKV